MAKRPVDRASLESLDSCKKSGDVHSKSGYREIFIILQKIGRSPAKSGDLEALYMIELRYMYVRHFVIICGFMLFRYLSCLGAIICDINAIESACRVCDSLMASCATGH